MIPVLYSFDASWPNPNHDVFEMFLASVVSFCSNSSEPLDLAVVCRGMAPWQAEALRMAARSGARQHSLRTYSEGSPEVERLDRLETRVSTGRKGYWPKCVFDRLDVKSFFPGRDRAFFIDMDVISHADLAGLFHELGDDVFLESVPDADRMFNMCHGKPYPKEPQICCGFTLCNLRLFPALEEFVDYFNTDRIDKDRDWVPAEQETLAYYAYDHGYRMLAFDPMKVTHMGFRKWDISDEAYRSVYAEFGVKDAGRPVDGGIEVYHFTYTSRDSMFYDGDSFEHRFYAPYQREARRIINGLTLSFPFIPKGYARATEVRRPRQGGRAAPPAGRTRTVVMSNQGSDRWYDFVLPSALSLSVHMREPFRLVMLEPSGGSSVRERDHLDAVVRYGGRSNSVEFREADPDTEMMSDSFWTPAHLHKLFAADLLSDIDDYCLFMDSDVLVADDLSPLFDVCDCQPDRDKVLGTLNWYHFVTRSDIPVQLSGGFFFMHPRGRAVSALRRMEFIEYWNANDEYVLGQCVSPSDFVNLGNACMEASTEGYANGAERLKRLAERGVPLGRVFAVHFLSSNDSPRFNRLRMRRDFRKYVDDWFFMKDMSKRIAFGGVA
jgi:lipopolysaccharide biosynthesis glycosyltransferase